MGTMIISIILIILVGMFNACMDVLKVRFNTSIFSKWKNQQWINPSLSWPNKWKPDSRIGDIIMSTVLVWLTDMWHFVKMLMIVAIAFAIVFYNPIVNWWVDVIIFYCTFTVTFELFFSKIFISE